MLRTIMVWFAWAQMFVGCARSMPLEPAVAVPGRIEIVTEQWSERSLSVSLDGADLPFTTTSVGSSGWVVSVVLVAPELLAPSDGSPMNLTLRSQYTVDGETKAHSDTFRVFLEPGGVAVLHGDDHPRGEGVHRFRPYMGYPATPACVGGEGDLSSTFPTTLIAAGGLYELASQPSMEIRRTPGSQGRSRRRACREPAGVTNPRPPSPTSWGLPVGTAGCATGLVVESGICCWRGQTSDGRLCVGPPTCPTGLEVSGSTCVVRVCPDGMVRMSGDRCCWPGQRWYSYHGSCGGDPWCPRGFVRSGKGCAPLTIESFPLHEALVTGPRRAPTTSRILGDLVWVPWGTFVMGSPTSEAGRRLDETPHRVVLTEGFYLMQSEVTQAMWQAVMGSTPSFNDGCDTCPVENVSWHDAEEFARRVSEREGVTYRLPTEAEWEFAARGGEAYVYAGSDELDAVGWHEDNADGTQPVCRKARNGFGLCDMSGNVWEWVADWYDRYPGRQVTDPTGPPSDLGEAVWVDPRLHQFSGYSGWGRVCRGGSAATPQNHARVAYRHRLAPDNARRHIGFRLARSSP